MTVNVDKVGVIVSVTDFVGETVELCDGVGVSV